MILKTWSTAGGWNYIEGRRITVLPTGGDDLGATYVAHVDGEKYATDEFHDGYLLNDEGRTIDHYAAPCSNKSMSTAKVCSSGESN